MKNREEKVYADFVIAGGGIPGVCSAIQAARMGLKVALINNRTYFGGNGGAEFMINLCGATGTNEYNYNARETGIIEELLLDNLYKNPNANRWIWDAVIMDKLKAEKNLMLFPNTCIDEVVKKDGKTIEYIAGTQSTTETRYLFYAPMFADDTGDGTVAYLSGAEYHYGREAQSEYGERLAPLEADSSVLPSTLVFTSEKRDRKIPYIAPSFATDIPATGALDYRVIPEDDFGNFKWFYEIDGNLDQIFEAETIIDHQKSLVYGIWDYIKNSGKYPADNHELSYVSPIPGKRESRRFLGDYILKEQDLQHQTDFEDTVGFGGWSIDLHSIDGFYSKEPINRHVILDGIYQIPFRSCYSKDIDNLMLEGRCMSLSHIAHGSARVMSTLATLGQAAAVAAVLCKKYSCTPRDVYKEHINELQRLLLKYDNYIVGKEYKDEENLAATAEFTVSSEKALGQTEGGMSKKLGAGLGISVPVVKEFSGIRLFAKADKPSKLTYGVYSSEKPENYKPDVLLFSGEAQISASADFKPVDLTADLKCKQGFYYIKLEGDGDIEFKLSEERYTGVECSHIVKPKDNYIDFHTLEKRDSLCKNFSGILCFEMLNKESVFGADNLKTGYTRPYIKTNVWHSAGLKDEYLALKWEKPVTLSKIRVIFDSYTNEYIRNEKDRIDGRRPSIAKDYDILAKMPDGSYKTLAELRGNWQRINDFDFEKITTDEIRINLLATNGQKFFSVYSVRAYK